MHGVKITHGTVSSIGICKEHNLLHGTILDSVGRCHIAEKKYETLMTQFKGKITDDDRMPFCVIYIDN